MTKKSGLLLLIFSIASLLSFFVIKDWTIERQLTSCIEEVLTSQKIDDVQTITKNRGQKPILKGKLIKEDKDKLLDTINRQCQVSEIQDFIETINPSETIVASLNFKIDYVNNILNIMGVVSSQQQIDEILDSFKTAIKDNFPPTELDWTISSNILIEEKVQTIDFAIYITLLFTAIDNIKLADITFENNQLILKGLVRDKIRKNETLMLVTQLFGDEFTIINQLDLVVKHKSDIQGIEFEPLTPPILKNPNNY